MTTVLEINGKRVEVDDGFKSLPEAEQQRIVESIASEMSGGKKSGFSRFMGQVNAGIGDVVDLLNPLDTPVVSEALGMGDRLSTGPAADAMNSVGITAATQDPEGFLEGLGRGFGQAAASAPVVAPVLQAGSKVGGAIGAAADDAYRALVTPGGMLAETSAGALLRGAEEGVEKAGGSELAQGVAGLSAALSIPAAAGALKTTGRIATKTPVIGYANRVARDVIRGVMPMTPAGAREQARRRVQDATGGWARSSEIADDIVPDPYGFTPAEQSGDPNLMGLQASAARENPVLREQLAAQLQQAEQNLAGDLRGIGGNPDDARRFFEQRQRQFTQNMQERVDRVIGIADEALQQAGPRRAQSLNSEQVVQRLKLELEDFRAENARKWAEVPLDLDLTGGNAAQAARNAIDTIPRAQQEDIPVTLRRALENGNELAGPTSAKELHGLYSKLRQVARNARAGTNTNPNMARIADDVAEALLRDLDAIAADTGINALRDALAHTRAMHETFDQGAVGRILRRTVATDEQIAPEVALDRTIGRQGSSALADNTSIRQAANETGLNIQDYLRSRFADKVFDASGEFTPKAARTWLRNNRELLSQYSGLRRELTAAVNNREAAQAFAARADARSQVAQGTVAGSFAEAPVGKEVQTIIGANDPVAAAGSVVRTAAKDPTGKALAGVQGAFTDYLTQDIAKLPGLIADKRLRAAMGKVFDEGQMRRIMRMSEAMRRAQTKPKDMGALMDSPTTRVVDMFLRIAAVKNNPASGSGIESFQINQMVSGRVGEIMRNMTNQRARQVLMDAIDDPELFKVLLKEPGALVRNEKVRSKLAPYLIGAGTAQEQE